MAATYPLLISFDQKILWTVDSRVIHFESKNLNQFQQILLLNWKLARIGSFRFLYMFDIFTKLFLQLIDINPRSLPPRNELILSIRAPACTIYNPTKNEGFGCNRTNNVEPRAPLFLDKSKMVDVKIHNGSCPSSRTLLSTTSFQTKFYHNIPLIWNRYEIDSIMES